MAFDTSFVNLLAECTAYRTIHKHRRHVGIVLLNRILSKVAKLLILLGFNMKSNRKLYLRIKTPDNVNYLIITYLGIIDPKFHRHHFNSIQNIPT